MRVLLTGGSSLLGAGVVRALNARGDEVVVLQRRPSAVASELGLTEHLADLNDADEVGRAMPGVEAVIHLAARVGVVGSAAQFHEANVTGTRTVLAAAQANGVSRFVFISSPSVAQALCTFAPLPKSSMSQKSSCHLTWGCTVPSAY